MLKTTTQEFADRLGIPYQDANRLLRGLAAVGAAERAGTIKKNPGTRGKGQTVYQVDLMLASAVFSGMVDKMIDSYSEPEAA